LSAIKHFKAKENVLNRIVDVYHLILLSLCLYLIIVFVLSKTIEDIFLFAGTVMENIRYGRLEASDDEVIAAARLANADWLIRRLPQGVYRSSSGTVLGKTTAKPDSKRFQPIIQEASRRTGLHSALIRAVIRGE